MDSIRIRTCDPKPLRALDSHHTRDLKPRYYLLSNQLPAQPVAVMNGAVAARGAFSPQWASGASGHRSTLSSRLLINR